MSILKGNLKQLAKDFDISMAQLSRETDVPPQTLNNWLAGAEPRSLTQVKKVADFFNITVDEFCFSNNKKSNNSRTDLINNYKDEINAGVFEVVLRRIRK